MLLKKESKEAKAVKVGRRLSARVGDFFKAKNAAPTAEVEKVKTDCSPIFDPY
jgi:hypothetical protein